MKKLAIKILCLIFCVCSLFSVACGDSNYILTENTYFKIMTNLYMYPNNYVGANIEADCFTYKITDIDKKEWIVAVRLCSSGYGCACGQDSVIGFLLDYDGEVPAPVNQSDKDGENCHTKAWIHLKGTLETAEKTNIKILSSTGAEEKIAFVTMKVESLTKIAESEFSSLAPYVIK